MSDKKISTTKWSPSGGQFVAWMSFFYKVSLLLMVCCLEVLGFCGAQGSGFRGLFCGSETREPTSRQLSVPGIQVWAGQLCEFETSAYDYGASGLLRLVQ